MPARANLSGCLRSCCWSKEPLFGEAACFSWRSHHSEDAMGKLVVTECITLDGVIEAPGGGEGFEHDGWSFKFNRGDEADKFKSDELQAADAQLLGRVTYQGFARAWPTMSGDPFSEKMNSMPKYVVSSTLSDADASWTNSTVIRDDVVN